MGSVALSSAQTQTSPVAVVKSPDHPETWVVGATNIHQALRWDNSRHMLVADVTYSTRDWADSMHPTRESEYTLAFPSVHLDRTSEALTANGSRIGHLTHGLFGTDVQLVPEAELDIHRQHGKIFAAIAPSMGDER